MTQYANPPAFPCDSVTKLGGMSLRDWFAGQALAAVIRSTAAEEHIPKHLADHPIELAMVMDAYRLADAMLAERAK